MLSEDKVIALYCIVDDMLKGMRYYEDSRLRVSDSEVIISAFVSVLYFGGHISNGCQFMKIKGYVPCMLDKSQFLSQASPAERFFTHALPCFGQAAERYSRCG